MKMPTKMLLGQITIASAATRVLATLLASVLPSVAQSRPPVNYEPPKDGETNPKTAPATPRPGCPETANRIAALVPKYYVGLTASDRPEFLVYIPYYFANEQSGKLILKDAETQRDIYQTTLPLTDTPGIISFRLPENAPQLQQNKLYQWDFLYTGNQGICRDITVQKLPLKRVTIPDSLKRQLDAAATPRDRVVLYAGNGLWHEAVAELASLRRQAPDDEDLKADWENLLRDRDVRLEQIASEPISPCCNANR